MSQHPPTDPATDGPPVLQLLPAVDVAGGTAVRLVQGEAGSQTDYGDPGEAARRWQSDGAQWVHLVDLDAAFGRGSNAGQLAQVIAGLDVDVELSGGIRDDASLSAALATGCRRVNIGTAALEQPQWCDEIIAEHGDRIAIGLDVRGRTLAARGWTQPGGDLFEVLERLNEAGCARYVVTDVSRDGTLTGPNTELLRQVCAATDAPVVASGGVSSLDDLRAIAALVPLGVEGAIIGKALYAGRFTLPEALHAMAAPGGQAVSVAVRVIPCLDVDAGRVVKGVNFAGLRDAGDPVELGTRYGAQGADELTLLDITASSAGRATTYDVVSRTAETLFIPLTVGGGVRSVDDVNALLRAGADKVSLNTAAVADPDLLHRTSRSFGSQCIVLSVDARRCTDGAVTASGFEITTHGGRHGTGTDAVAWAQQAERAGVGEILLNSIDADGTTAGFDLEMIAALRVAVDVPLIASGGAGTAGHFAAAADAGADAILAASVFHFGAVSIAEAKAAIAAAGHEVR